MPNPTAITTEGPVEGVYVGDVARFLGIPYAQAPEGDLAFEAPVRAKKRDGVFHANKFGATPQRRPFGPVTTIPEPVIAGDDVLNLNVFVPKGTKPSDKLPVLFYIHGGGYVAGSHVGEWFHGQSFNANGVIVVTISYRLGFKGFGVIQDAPNNRGLLDMVSALEWVQDNIENFGGNPKAVTISGQSAGGGAVLCLLSMPKARGLFQRAIPHSAAPSARNLATALAEAQRTAAIAGVPNTKAGWGSVSEDAMLDAQNEQAEEFAKSVGGGLMGAFTQSLTDNSVSIDYGPVLDPETQPMEAFEAIKTLNADVPILLGATSEEFMMPTFVQGNPEADREALRKLKRPGRFETDIQYAIDSESTHPMGTAITNVFFHRAVRDALKARPTQTYAYLFDYQSPINGRAGHCIELPFAWNCLVGDAYVKACLGDNPSQEIADDMHNSWVSFIKTGNPGWGSAQELACRVYTNHGAHTVHLASTEDYAK